MESMDTVFNRVQEIKEMEQQVEKKKQNLSDVLTLLRETKGKQFVHEGSTYQIRNRQGRYYIAKMTKKPGRKKAVPEQPTEAQAEE